MNAEMRIQMLLLGERIEKKPTYANESGVHVELVDVRKREART